MALTDETAETYEEFLSDIKVVLLEVMREEMLTFEVEDGVIVNSSNNISNMARLRRRLTAVVGEVQFEFEDRLEADLALIVADTVEGLPELPKEPDPTVFDRISEILENNMFEVAGVLASMMLVPRSTSSGAVISQQTTTQTLKNTERKLEVKLERAKNATEAAIYSAQRATTVEVVSDAAPAWVYYYEGPFDSRIRKFCYKYAKKAYSKEALERLAADPDRKGQPLPVFAHLGGYRCRHLLAPMPIETARERGYRVIL